MKTEKKIWGEALSCIAEAHWRSVGRGLALRNIAKRQVTRVCYDGESFIVKTYRLGWFRRMLGLRVRSFECLECLDGLTPACLCDKSEGNWQLTVFEDAGKSNLFEMEYNVADDASTLACFSEAGRLLAEMHRRNVFHGDTKTPNFVVNDSCPELPPIVIVDCDKVLEYRELPALKKAFNLAQFLESANKRRPVDSVVSHMMAFCNAYKEKCGLDDAEWRRFFLLACDIAENNRHIERRTSPEAIKRLKDLQGV